MKYILCLLGFHMGKRHQHSYTSFNTGTVYHVYRCPHCTKTIVE